MVRVGSARINEKGTINGGKAGDQTGSEVSTQQWYPHKKGWIVIRAKDPSDREAIARNMEQACANDNIGYCQVHRSSLTAVAARYGYDTSKVNTKVETDCSELVRVCVLFAGIIVGVFNTSSEVSVLLKTGAFTIHTSDEYTKKTDKLLRGDILVTKTKGHTVVVLDNGDDTDEAPAHVKTTYKVRSGDNLTKISRKFGTTPAKLVKDNIGKYPRMTKNYIQVGWVLEVK